MTGTTSVNETVSAWPLDGLPAQLAAKAALSEGVDGCFAARSGYVEQFWLPVVGPTCLLILRRLGPLVDAYPGGVNVDLDELAGELGVGCSKGRNSPVQRSLARLYRFGLASYEPGVLFICSSLPVLPSRFLRRLPETLRHAHPGCP